MSMRKFALHSALVLALASAAPAFMPLETAAQMVPSFSGVVRAAQPAVVTVRIARARESAHMAHMVPEEERKPDSRNFLERLFGKERPEDRKGRNADDMAHDADPPEEESIPQGLGSGFIIDPSGVIVTNLHVVAESNDITVELDDGTELKATLIGADDKTDIAVLRVDAGRKLPSVAWGDSDAVDVGDWAIAIGNPFGLGGSVSAGIISARGRDISSGPYDDFLQIDAPINRGNSGGPLFNQKGGVIGVNAAIFSPSGGSVGIAFAIPSNQARKIVSALVEHGFVTRGWIGIAIQQITPEIAATEGLPRDKGVVVASVQKAGPAQMAGIRRGDIILSYGDTKVMIMRDLTRAVADTSPGRHAPIRVLRDGVQQVLMVRAAPYPS